MDFAIVLQKVIEFWVYILSKEFTFAGFTTTVGAVVIWSALAGLVIWILKGLVD